MEMSKPDVLLGVLAHVTGQSLDVDVAQPEEQAVLRGRDLQRHSRAGGNVGVSGGVDHACGPCLKDSGAVGGADPGHPAPLDEGVDDQRVV